MSFIKTLELQYSRTPVQKEQTFHNKLTGDLLNSIDTLKATVCVLSGCNDVKISKIDTESFTVTWSVSETDQQYLIRVLNQIELELITKCKDLLITKQNIENILYSNAT